MAGDVNNFTTGTKSIFYEGNSFITENPLRLDYWFLEIALIILNKWTPVFYVPFGVIGNITSFLITTKKKNRNISTCIYMSALAVADTMALLAALFYRVLFGHGIGAAIQSRFHTLVFFWYWSFTAAMTSGLYLAFMSLDRALAIAFPLKAKTFCTASRAKKAIGVAFFIPAILNSNMFFTYQHAIDETTGIESASLNYPEPRWVEMVVGAYMLAVGTIIPFIIIMTCNVIIITKVQSAARSRSKMAADGMGGATTEEKHLTRMLILVAIAYVILSIPMRLFDMMFTLPEIIEKYNMEDPYWQLRYNVEYWTVSELWNSNFAVNFYLYFLGGGKKYRNDAKQVFSMCFRKIDQQKKCRIMVKDLDLLRVAIARPSRSPQSVDDA